MSPQRKQCGVSMIELMMVIAIATILMMIAVPSYKYVTTSNRIAAEINGLMGDMEYARYEAIKEGLNVTVCPVTKSTDVVCTATTTWSGGWIVLSSLNGVMRRQEPFTSFNSKDTLTAAGITSLVFNREGFATPAGGVTAMFSLHDSTNSTSYTRCLIVNPAGALMTTTYGNTVYSSPNCS